ncbi:MAG: universal stress protein [Terracidiphilus sp.]
MIGESLQEVAIRNIAVATDFGPWSYQAARHALVVARQFGAVVHFLHAVRRSEFAMVPDLMIELDELTKHDCDDFMERLGAVRDLDDIESRCWNMDGEIPDVFGSLVSQLKVDLLVLGTRGRTGISKFLFGSVAEEICRNVSCPVLTLGPLSRRPSRELSVKRILFVTDLSKESQAVIPYVSMAARTWGAAIDLLQFDSLDRPDLLLSAEEFSSALSPGPTGKQPSSIRYQGAAGKLSATVLDVAKRNRNDLIVLGLEHDHSLYGSGSGSDAYEIICQASCPVLSVCSSFRGERSRVE